MLLALRRALPALPVILLALTPGLAAQQVVPGPWGPLVDHVPPAAYATDAARVTEYRRHQMRAISGLFRSVEMVVEHGAPFQDRGAADAAGLARLARDVAPLFAPGTAAPAGRRGARPAIWDEPERFAQHAEGFRVATAALAGAAAAGAALAQPLLAVRHECLACHQRYREFPPRQ